MLNLALSAVALAAVALLQASYVQYILGSETFSRGFQLGFNYFWGPNRDQ